MADYEIVAIDMRGYGGSDAPRGVQRYRMEHLCGDLAAVVTAAGHTSCLLVAHDWGGAVAWCFAANYPRMVDRLAVLCSPHPAAFQDPRRCTAAQRRKSWYFLLFMARGLPEALLRSRDFQMVEELMTQAPGGARTPGAISPEDVERYKAGLARPGALTAAVNYYRASIESLTSRPSKAVQT
jgi:pimeloyl-ACP methyl ester carboxylesterase